ncbi:MAG: amidohydrolase [Bacteroidales bacterium]|nr:amidohydrolase [Candidatus Colimorpha onthohippi]
MLRHLLHQNPGISGCEQYAHDLIVSTLQQLSPTALHTHVGGYGVVAFWGDSTKPCIALRADTDALPINESNTLPYCSHTAGISHKCGHDGHTATLLQVAQLLVNQIANLDTGILLIFQPEEETGTGACKMIASGILQQYNIKAIYGYHNLPGFGLGDVVICNRTFAAASSGVIYSLQGRQTHASTPEKGINPGRAIAQIINQILDLSSAVDADIDQFRQATLICTKIGDEAFGTSAGYGQVMFTLRAYTNQNMRQLQDAADTIAQTAAHKYGLTLNTSLREPFHATENHPQCVNHIRDIALRHHYVITEKDLPFRWSEDFAEYLLHYPGALFGIGAGKNHPELHHPDYDFPDEIINPAAQLLLSIACE